LADNTKLSTAKSILFTPLLAVDINLSTGFKVGCFEAVKPGR